MKFRTKREALDYARRQERETGFLHAAVEPFRYDLDTFEAIPCWTVQLIPKRANSWLQRMRGKK